MQNRPDEIRKDSMESKGTNKNIIMLGTISLRFIRLNMYSIEMFM